jgi:hypothetical protein
VHVQPYARRRFDGLRADTPEVITEKTADGVPYTITRHILGSAPAKLPIPEPQCMELGQLIDGEKFTDPFGKVEAEALRGRVLRVGKHRFAQIK